MAEDNKEEKKISAYDELRNTYAEMNHIQGILGRFAHLQDASGLASKVAEGIGDNDAAAALSAPPEGMQYVPFLNHAFQDASKRLEQITENRLEDIINSSPDEKIEQFLSMAPVDSDKMGVYGEVAELYKDVGRIMAIQQAVGKGNTEVVEGPMMEALSRYYDEQYPDDEQNDYRFIRQGMKLLALKDKRFRIHKYFTIADEMVKKKRGQIAERLKDKKVDYIKAVLSQEITLPDGNKAGPDEMERLFYSVLLRDDRE